MKKFLLCLASAIGLGCSAQIPTLEPKAFVHKAQADSSAVILDVRQPSEFADGHIPGAINIDWLNRAEFNREIKELPKDKTYYIYCRSGRRSHEAATKMASEGFSVIDMKGGILSYESSGLPLEK